MDVENLYFTSLDFNLGLTMNRLYDEVGPKLKEVIEDELGVGLGFRDGQVDGEGIREAMKQAEIIKAFLAAYTDAVAAGLCIIKANFYGDKSAKEAIQAYLGPNGEELRKRDLEDLAKAFLESEPAEIVRKDGDQV